MGGFGHRCPTIAVSVSHVGRDNRKDNQVWAVSIETDSGFVARRPRLLFEGDYLTSFPVRTYDRSADGKRFLMVGREPFPDTPITHLNVVLNWFEELKRLVPAN